MFEQLAYAGDEDAAGKHHCTHRAVQFYQHIEGRYGISEAQIGADCPFELTFADDAPDGRSADAHRVRVLKSNKKVIDAKPTPNPEKPDRDDRDGDEPDENASDGAVADDDQRHNPELFEQPGVDMTRKHRDPA